MDVKILKQYLQKIEELVLDEDQIVTYKFLSRHLGIHVNTSKQLLYSFFKQQQSSIPCGVSASYLLAGQMKDGSHYISIVGENDFERMYKKFNEITSEHIYSIQKGKITSLKKNCQMLYAVDSKLESIEGYPIKFNKAIQRIKPVIHEEKHEDVKAIGDKKESGGTGPSLRKEDKVKAKKTGQISNFFSKQERQKKVKESTEECAAGKNINETKSIEGVRGNGKAALATAVDERTSESERVEKNVKSKPNKIAPEKPNKANRSKKKRKRILSDSEESEDDEEMQDAFLSAAFEVADEGGRPNLEEEAEEDKNTMRNKRKRKKIIDKTILREDGYMETLKEIVYETDSDAESSKNDGKIGAAKNSSRDSEEQEQFSVTKGKIHPGKVNQKKQSTLFSYFKKN